MQRNRLAVAVAVLMVGVLLAGCEVETQKDGDGKDVRIATPFGGMQVKTNDAVVLEGTGLPAYPGAVRVKDDKDNGAADVDMNFGSFQMRVKAMSYRTSDAPGKVEAFYRDGLKQFGDVIACRGSRPVGEPAQTAEGLTCESGKHGPVAGDGGSGGGELELKAGSKEHQHIVGIEPEGGGTKFGLVALDLPGKAAFHDGGDGEDRQ